MFITLIGFKINLIILYLQSQDVIQRLERMMGGGLRIYLCYRLFSFFFVVFTYNITLQIVSMVLHLYPQNKIEI